MYTLQLQKEKVVGIVPIKLMVNENNVGKTSIRSSKLELEESISKVKLKALVVSTNEVQAPQVEGDYHLEWKQNYTFVCILFGLFCGNGYFILELLGKVSQVNIIALGSVNLLIMLILWNDLLLIGRKIVIECDE